MSKSIPIIWDTKALIALEEIVEYLEVEVSMATAKKVVKRIKDTIAALPNNPEIFPIDPFIQDRSLKIRFFEKYSYRVLYRYYKNEIYILTVRHSSKAPLEGIIS